ncbi:nodulation protein NfeD [Parvularcula sp. IMCC14364]|uniref:NfeD family protein n=1 Tax=Parvularcula sp. IMCC14364 TaxID=3067902 RepID=UPI0027422AA6|nr:nodulation protein NfeD [Parvularcula sp. IMCC14364]
MQHARSYRKFFLFLIVAGLASLLLGTLSSLFAQNGGSRNAVVLELNGVVEPTVAGYLSREIETANDTGADLVIIEIDTPGGLVTSMRDIIKSILASDIPVVTFVSPQGSQSASAGLYIMYSAHVSAMAPATNTGAATPVSMGGDGGDGSEEPFFPELEQEEPTEETNDEAPAETTETEPASGETSEETASEGDAGTIREDAQDTLEDRALEEFPADSSEDAMRRKIVNDSVAYIRSLAEKRGRNADWAERAVREAVSVTANEALELNVIDLMAEDLDDLLTQIDGRVVETAAGDVTIATEGMQLTRVEPKLWEVILSIITDPTIAAILLSIGTLGITAEIWNPGSIFPGTVGLICLLLAFYSFQILPFEGLWLAVMGVGVLLIMLEAYTPTFGVSGLFGLALFGVGMWFLFPEDVGRVSPIAIISILAVIGMFLMLMLIALTRTRGHGPLIGAEAIRKREGKVEDWDEEKGEGIVIVDGERWRARSKTPFKPGDIIKVVEVNGLVLDVKSAQGDPGLSRFMPGRGKPQGA